MLLEESSFGARGWIVSTIVALLCVACSDSEKQKEATTREASDPIETSNPVELAPIPSRSGILETWRKSADDPKADGWESEVLAAAAQAQLERLGELLIAGDPAAAVNSVADLLTDHEALTALVPTPLSRVFDDGVVTVDRFPRAPVWSKPAGGLAGVLAGAGPGPGEGGEGARFKFKVIEVQPAEAGKEGFVTRQYFSIAWRTSEAVIEQNSTWIVDWQPAGDSPPLMKRVAVGSFEQTRTVLGSGRALFADCTESVLSANPSYREQLLRGLNYWLERMPYRVPMNFSGSPGLAVGDVNGDGLDDLYLCQEAGLPNRLFLQNADGTLRDVSTAWGVDWIEDSRGVLMVDLDNDGDQDLVVAVSGGVVLASNESGRGFQLRTVLPTSRSTTSLSAADFDRDGLPDLYVCCYAPDGSLADPAQVGALPNRFVYHDANDGAANSLFHNRTREPGRWEFAEVTSEAGLDPTNHRWSFAASWEDYDNDGDQDLYVANDFGRNNLYRNDGGSGTPKFVDVAAEAGVEDSASGMSVSWGDCDRDGRMDLYVSNMFSAAGSRITTQPKFKPGVSNELRNRFQHFARGNTLLRNLGQEGFEDVSVAAGVTMGRWAWGSSFADLNNDGWEDLVVANGYVTADDDGDL